MIGVNQRLVSYLETVGIDEPVGMSVDCPVCGTGGGIWCEVVVSMSGNRIGFLHADRVRCGVKSRRGE